MSIVSNDSANWKRMTPEEKDRYVSRLLDELSSEEDDDKVPDSGEENDNEENEMTIQAEDIYASDEEHDAVLEVQSESESDSEYEDELPANTSQEYYVSKDGTKWNKDPQSTGRKRLHNIVRIGNKGTKRTLDTSSPLSIFKSFMTEEIVSIIVRETNRKAETTLSEQNKTWTRVTETELYAYFGLLLAAGRNHANLVHTKELWQTSSDPVFRATMSLERFWAISRFIRFDNQITRLERQRNDKAAAIRDIWEMLNVKLRDNFTPGEAVTIDEQLFPYRGRTKFTQYIPSKPAKYGIKVWWACDATNGYPCQGIIYTGKKDGQVRETNQGQRVLLELSEAYKSSGRTIVADNFFTSLEAVKILQSKALAFVGTLRKNKTCIPAEMMPARDRPACSTEFGFQENVSLVSYVPKKNKAVLLLSSVHYGTEVGGHANKPEAILYYNQHKGGVDRMDQMLGEYTCKRQTKRWPLAFFFNMLDVAALAAYCCHTLSQSKKTDARRNFLKELVRQIVTPQIEERIEKPKVIARFSVRNGIEAFLGKPILGLQKVTLVKNQNVQSTQKKSCRLCRQEEGIQRKTRFLCCDCFEPVCLQHSKQSQTCYSCIPV